MMNQGESLTVQILFRDSRMPRLSFEVIDWDLIVRYPHTRLYLIISVKYEIPVLMNKSKLTRILEIVELLSTSFYLYYLF